MHLRGKEKVNFLRFSQENLFRILDTYSLEGSLLSVRGIYSPR